ncbi:unnamed protein product [Pedinophyceae sp. YPF-701]|nr:unnamed protein product [Pedinophyceae sp. YPF-701]
MRSAARRAAALFQQLKPGPGAVPKRGRATQAPQALEVKSAPKDAVAKDFSPKGPKKGLEDGANLDPASTGWPWSRIFPWAVGGSLLTCAVLYTDAVVRDKDRANRPTSETSTIENWSGTHSVETNLFQPETVEELERIVRDAYSRDPPLKIRPVGSGLSPNGIAFESEGMISLALLDKVLSIDTKRNRVTVQAGARVQEVVEALRPHGLTLQNYASIREQQIGGFTQVSAHGTGAKLPPVDMQVVSMKVVTPGKGTITLDATDGSLFELTKVGLGMLGVVSEVTLQCVPAHRLLEKTFTATRAEVKKNHSKWLRENKHLRYMWIPYTDTVVVVQCNESRDGKIPGRGSGWFSKPFPEKEFTDAERLEPLRDLYLRMNDAKLQDVLGLSATQLRDHLLALNPLGTGFVSKVNEAEAEFWRRSQGYRIGWSDEILGFDCGGQQWVLEVAFPTGTLKSPSGADIAYMEELLDEIERRQVPAPAPIEQRWSARSSSLMSPAHSENPDTVFSWIGVIMYLPTSDPVERAMITSKFRDYVRMCEDTLMPKYGAYWHWAKLELPSSEERRRWLRSYIANKYPIRRFHARRREVDPKGQLANEVLEEALAGPAHEDSHN